MTVYKTPALHLARSTVIVNKVKLTAVLQLLCGFTCVNDLLRVIMVGLLFWYIYKRYRFNTYTCTRYLLMRPAIYQRRRKLSAVGGGGQVCHMHMYLKLIGPQA